MAGEALENAGTPVMLLKTLPRGQSIVYKGRLLVGRHILPGFAVKASFVSKEEGDFSQSTQTRETLMSIELAGK